MIYVIVFIVAFGLGYTLRQKEAAKLDAIKADALSFHTILTDAETKGEVEVKLAYADIKSWIAFVADKV